MSKLSAGNNADRSEPVRKLPLQRTGTADCRTFAPPARGILSMQGPSTSVDRLAVTLCELNAQSVSFRIDRFLWPQRACVISLRSMDGASVHIPGQVKQCLLEAGRTHACEVQFESPVEVDRFITGPPKPPAEDIYPRPQRRTGF